MPDIELLGATYPDVPAVDLPKSGGGLARFYDPSGINYAASAISGGSALSTEGIPYGAVDSTSTSTAFTATVPGITELKDGTVVLLKNGVVTSAANFTININSLGAKPAYSNMATGNDTTPTAPTRETTIFNINYTMMFIYCEDLVDGGAWICYRGYDANTNTIGYQLRTNSMSLPMSGALYRYRLLFTSVDGKNWIPANTTNSTDANAEKTTNSAYFDPFGAIRYYGGTSAVSSGSRPSASALWQQYVFNIGYSFNKTGAAPTLTAWRPVYLKCTINPNGGVRFASTPYVQALPTAADLTHVYIYLGVAYSATNVEMAIEHPVYYHDGTAIQRWNGVAIPRTSADVGAIPAPANPQDEQILVYNSTAGQWQSGDLNQQLGAVNASYYYIEYDSNAALYRIDCDVSVVADEIASCRKVLFLFGSNGSFDVCYLKHYDTNTGYITLECLTDSINVTRFYMYPDISEGGFAGTKTVIYQDDYMYENETKRPFAVVEVNGTTYIGDDNGNPVTYDAVMTAFFSSRDMEIGVVINGISEAYVGKIVYYNNSTATLRVSCITAYNDVLMTFTETNDVLVMTASDLRPLDAIANPGNATDGDFLVYDGTNGLWTSQAVTIPSASSATPQALGTASAGSSTDYSRADHVHAKPTAAQIGAVPGSGTTCNSGSGSNCEHNANNMWQNGFYYIGSNQNNPPVSLGVQNADASCFVQSYSEQWVTQIAQDYRDGQMFVRSKKNGVWQAWKAVPMFTTSNGAKGSATQPLYVDADGMLQPTTYTLGASVPAVTSADNGKVMRVVDGAWAAVSLPSASGVSF